MRVIICGSRYWSDRDMILDFMKTLPKDTVIIHGNANGADTIAGEIGKELNLEVIPYPAKWKRYGRSAGPIRNKQMIDEGHPDLVVAFHNDIINSKGTADMIRQAKKAGITTSIFPIISGCVGCNG